MLSFPCDFPIKVFGRNLPSFRETALACVSEHCADPVVAEQISGKGNFVSLTVTVRAQSRIQLDAIYRSLRQLREVLMVL